MDSISLEELKEKLDAGESIDEIAKEHSVRFYSFKATIPDFLSIEQLVEIIEKIPELFTTADEIPGWVFLLLLVREKFDIVDSLVEQICKRKKYILTLSEKENISNETVYKTILTISQQITKEQISMLISILEKRKSLLSHYSKYDIAYLLMGEFLRPFKNYLDEEHFLSIFDWIRKETKPYMFKYIYTVSDFFDKLSVESPSMQERLADCFISANASYIIDPNTSGFRLFIQKGKVELLNNEIFISSVVKVYSKLSDIKRVYLLNFPYFLENYPHLVIKSLKVFMDNLDSCSRFILKDNKIFIPDKIWDTVVKKDSTLLPTLIEWLPYTIFSFNVDYVSNIAKIACFVSPENLKEVFARLQYLKLVFSKNPEYKIIKE